MARAMIADQALLLLATLPLTQSVSGFNNTLSDVKAFSHSLRDWYGACKATSETGIGECLPLPLQLHHIPNFVDFALSPLYFWTSRCASFLQC